MNMFAILIGIVIAACIFAALLWSIYRAVVTTGRLRTTYIVLALSTLMVVSGITWTLNALLLTASVSLIVTAIIAMIYEARWSKLLPLAQLLLGGLAFFVAMDVLIKTGLSAVLENL